MKRNTLLNHFICLQLILMPVGKIFSQQLLPSVISSSGGFYSNSSGMLSFTTGEMSAIETYTSSNVILTQGFQQVWELGTSIDENQDVPFLLTIYPNPSEGHFNLMMNTEWYGTVNLRIIDLLGREVRLLDFDKIDMHQVESIDLSDVAQGIYLVTISIQDLNAPSRAHQVIEKIQIIR